jgi:DNA-binding response OmpR family regulator
LKGDFDLEMVVSGEGELEEKKFHLILLDYRLPGVNGLEVLREIRPENQVVKIIMVTAFGSLEMAIKSLKSEANDFVAKPFEVQGLLEKIYSLLQEEEVFYPAEQFMRESAWISGNTD